MRKKFVVDTSVLLYDLKSLYSFEDNEVIIPLTVYQELDRLKDEASERGFVARKTLIILEELSKVRPLTLGVALGEVDKDSLIQEDILSPDTFIRRDYNVENEVIANKIGLHKNDYRIIACALNNDAILISRDRGMRALASDFVQVEDYHADKVNTEELYKGYRRIVVPEDVITQLHCTGGIKDVYGLYPNEFVIFESDCNPAHTSIGICKKGYIRPCDFKRMGVPGQRVTPLNLEQKMLLYLLLDEDVKCVTVTGVSGKGKSLLCVDYALASIKQGNYNSFLYTKSVIAVDQREELGFYKGSMEEKLRPHLQPLYSSVEYLYRNELYKVKTVKTGAVKESKVVTVEDKVWELMESGILRFYPLANIRGMSINEKVVMLDEAQNTTNHMIKSLVTRMNDNSKLVIAGDIEQIDDKNLNKYNNGLVHLIEAGKDEPSVAHICMDIDAGCKRGKLAEFGTKKL